MLPSPKHPSRWDRMRRPIIKHGILASFGRTGRYFLLRFQRLRGSIHSLALGAAIGAGVGVTPTLPLHNLLIICFTLLFRANPLAGILAGTVISNPLTFVPQYYLAWKIGNFFFPGRLTWETLQNLLTLVKQHGVWDSMQALHQVGFDALLVMLSGGLTLALPIGLTTYILIQRFFLQIEKKKLEKHLLNNPKP